MSSDSEVGFMFLGFLGFLCLFLVLACFYYDAKKRKKVAEERAAQRQIEIQRIANQMDYNPRVNSNVNRATTTIPTAPAWTSQIAVESNETNLNSNNNTLPQFEVRHPQNTTRLGFVFDEGTDNERNISKNFDGLPTYQEALNLPKIGEDRNQLN